MWRNGKVSTLFTSNKTRGYPGFIDIFVANKGRHIAFSSYAQDLGSKTLPWSRRCYVWSRKSGKLTLLAGGQICQMVGMSEDGELFYQTNLGTVPRVAVADPNNPSRPKRLPTAVGRYFRTVSTDGQWCLFEQEGTLTSTTERQEPSLRSPQNWSTGALSRRMVDSLLRRRPPYR